MLDADIIEPSRSQYASPCSLVSKKDSTWRVVIDYRKLNDQVIKDKFPLPSIASLLDRLQGSKVFSTLDLKSAYHQILLDKKDRHKSAFTCHKGLFQYKRVPMGLTLSANYQQRHIEIALRDCINKGFCQAYLDDVIIHSNNDQEHLEHIRQVFECLRKYSLKVKRSKCDLMKKSLKLLGHIISAEGKQPDPDKIKAVQNMARP